MTNVSPSSSPVAFRPSLAVALALMLHLWLALGVSNRVGPAFDEPTHIVSGLYHNLAGDFRFQPENGTLPQRLEALPWVLAGQDLPARDGLAWEKADMWALSHRLFQNAGPDAYRLLFWSRLTTALAGLLLLWVIYRWSASIFGRVGGLVSLAFAATCPNLLAHAGLATSDTWGTLGLFLATLAIWRVCHRVTPTRVLCAGLSAGFLALCKFNVVLLPVIAAGLVVLRLTRRAPLPCATGGNVRRLRGWLRLPVLAAAATGAVAISLATIWAGYGFRYAASPSPDVGFHLPFDRMLLVQPTVIRIDRLGEPADRYDIQAKAGALEKGLQFARGHRLLPEAWIYGCAFVAYNARARQAYFAGEHHELGRTDYFPVAFLLKSPLPGLVALLFAALSWAALPRPRVRLLYRLSPVLVLGGVILAAAIFSNVNIGLRHILPVIAVLWLCTGALGFRPANSRTGAIRLGIAIVLILAQTTLSIRQTPHHLTFFNTLAGPQPDHWFVDSNLDWGQGLPELKSWLDAREDQLPVFLSYFGTDDPARHGISVTRFADFHSHRGPRSFPIRLTPGWYALSPTQFRRAYGETRGNWTLEREAKYHQVLGNVAALAKNRDQLSVEARRLLFEHLELLTFARLCHLLSARPPDLRLPGGIMLFKLDQADLDLACYAPLNELNRVITEGLTHPVR